MTTLADSLVSTTSRPLRIRKRPDLTARRQEYNKQPYWVVKEPLAMRYFRFQEEEYEILNMLDGNASLEEIKNRFERKFAPQKIEYRDLQHLIGTLHSSGLVVSTVPGQGIRLWKRGSEQRWKKFLGTLTNVFAIRWRGVDPERFLNWLYPYTKWFFTWTALCICVLLGLAALTTVLVQFSTFQTRLPAFQEFFGPQNWIWFAVTLAVVKVFHELGHGLSCKHFGGECHEIGFMMLVFTPALYCNVSDSWLLESKWKRAAIGAAGIYVEVVFASIATFVWWLTDPSSLVNNLALSVMFICSVNTIMFNGNPLLRFDGYYIMSDLVEIPNLRQKATEVLRRWIFQVCMGVELPDDPFLPKRRRLFLALYTIAAVVYRWLVVFSILMFLNQVLEPYGLKIIGRMIAVIGFFGLVVQPFWQLIQFFRVPGRVQEVKWHRVFITLAVVVAVASFILFVRLPHYVHCSFTVEPRDAETVYVEVPGRLVEVLVEAGQQVKEGDDIARLEDPQLKKRLAQLESEEGRLQQQIEDYIRLGYDDRDAGRRKLRIEGQLADVKDQLEQVRKRREKLTITAPADGIVFPAGVRQPQPSRDEGELSSWSGWPLDPENVNATFEKGQPLCRIGHPTRRTAMLAVDQGDVKFVEPGQPVYLQLESRRGTTMTSTIKRVAKNKMPATPRSLSQQGGGEVATRTDRSGMQQPLSAKYQARAELAEEENQLQVGLRGHAKIYTGYLTIGTRAWRAAMRLFNFDL